MILTEETTWQDAVDAWRGGESVWSAELGGLGPGYEQAIQVFLFEIMSRWPKDSAVPEPEDGKLPSDFRAHADMVLRDIDEQLGGLSGAMYGAAVGTAYRYMKHGYGHMLKKPEIEDRLIQVSTAWPSATS